MSTDIAVFGVYPSGTEAERGAADLIAAGFPTPDISVLLADLRTQRELRAAVLGGSTAGGLLNGALAILDDSGAQVVAGVGTVVAAGPITESLEGLSEGGAEGLTDALVGWGISEPDAKSYEGHIQEGGTLLAVRCASSARAKRAKQVLNSSGADEVAESNERRAA